MELYHLSCDPKLKLLKKKIPNRVFRHHITKNKIITEDKTIERISFGQSIEGCLTAITPLVKNILYVYIPDQIVTPYIPTQEQVPDAFITREVWITDDCKVKCIGKIRAISSYVKYRNTNKGYRIIQHIYCWEWIEKQNEVNCYMCGKILKNDDTIYKLVNGISHNVKSYRIPFCKNCSDHIDYKYSMSKDDITFYIDKNKYITFYKDKYHYEIKNFLNEYEMRNMVIK